jgi:hypothetical protein
VVGVCVTFNAACGIANGDEERSATAAVAVVDGGAVAADCGTKSIGFAGDGAPAAELVEMRGAETDWPANPPLLVVVVTGRSTYMIAAASAITNRVAAIANTVGANCDWDRLRERSTTTPVPPQEVGEFGWSPHRRPAAGPARSSVI